MTTAAQQHGLGSTKINVQYVARAATQGAWRVSRPRVSMVQSRGMPKTSEEADSGAVTVDTTERDGGGDEGGPEETKTRGFVTAAAIDAARRLVARRVARRYKNDRVLRQRADDAKSRREAHARTSQDGSVARAVRTGRAGRRARLASRCGAARGANIRRTDATRKGEGRGKNEVSALGSYHHRCG